MDDLMGRFRFEDSLEDEVQATKGKQLNGKMQLNHTTMEIYDIDVLWRFT